jgi:hypothetical protein
MLTRLFGRSKVPRKKSPESGEHSTAPHTYAPGDMIAGKYLLLKVVEGGLGRIFVVTERNGAPFVLKSLKQGNLHQQEFLRVRTR